MEAQVANEEPEILVESDTDIRIGPWAITAQRVPAPFLRFCGTMVGPSLAPCAA
jgi:hypothetical protein